MSHNVAECPTSQNHLLRRFPLVTPSPYHVIVLLSLLLSLPSFASPATQPSGQLLPWLDNLEDAYKEAGRTQKPILVIFSADWCEPCKALHEQIETPAAQKTLASWTRVNLNFDTDEADANLLNATRIPALRILTPAGALIASHDGPMSADTLTAWLTSSAAEATVALGAEFTGAASPDAATLAKLVDALGSSKSLLREAATRRLLGYPHLAAPTVLELLSDGKLAKRLSAMEVLSEWKAPLEGIDPWHPESITSERVAALHAWAKQLPDAPTSRPSALSGAALADALREIRQLLQASTAADAATIRDRLARTGPALLPEVAKQLAAAGGPTADNDRQRLTALRYRILATDRLVLAWPNGLERLSSLDSAQRHQAMDELSKRSSADDAPLLLGLFSDPDPLIRESALKLLQSIGGVGSGASGRAFRQLLADADPNVRAAVLKQLTETPDHALAADIIQYAKNEKETDLIVHAVRVLRAMKTKATVDCLMELLHHNNWRVRAEAAEALTTLAKARETAGADIYPVMLDLLNDPDGFVCSRAVVALENSNLSTAVKPMFEAAAKHPELLGDVIGAVSRSESMRAPAVPFLRKLCADPRPTARAQAIWGLAIADPRGAGELLGKALADDAGEVRIAAAEALLSILNQKRPQDGMVMQSRYFGMSEERVAVDPVTWLDDFRAGKGRPQWMAGLIPPLEKMLAADVASEQGGQLAAAVPLTALGQDDRAYPWLLASAKSSTADVAKISAALPWLPWEKRLELFNSLVAAHPAEDDAETAATEFIIIPDPRGTEPLWKLLALPGASLKLANSIASRLETLYLGPNYYNIASVAASARTSTAKAAREKALGGTPMQRLAAEALLISVSLDDAVEVASTIYQDPKSDLQTRTDALQIQLLAMKKADGQKLAIDTLANPERPLVRVALSYLALGSERLRQLREVIYLSVDNPDLLDRSYSGGQPIPIEIPPKLKAEPVKPLLQDSDPQTAACAGYLLCVLGQREGLDPLLKYWRSKAAQEEQTVKLVYRAVTALNDDTLTPILEELYNAADKHRSYEFREFYWTIRPIEGPNALKLRKKIRDEIGMDNLR